MSQPNPIVPVAEPSTEPAMPPDPTTLDANFDGDIRYKHAEAPTHDETIRLHALSLAISERSRLLETDSLDTLLGTAARFEAWIRGGSA